MMILDLQSAWVFLDKSPNTIQHNHVTNLMVHLVFEILQSFNFATSALQIEKCKLGNLLQLQQFWWLIPIQKKKW